MTKHEMPTFYLIWIIGSVLMAIIILPWYIYFVIRRPRIKKQAAAKVKYTLLDFEMLKRGEKPTGWKEIANGMPNIEVTTTNTQTIRTCKVYSSSDSQRVTKKSPTAAETQKSSSIKSKSVTPDSSSDSKTVSGTDRDQANDKDDNAKNELISITGTEMVNGGPEA